MSATEGFSDPQPETYPVAYEHLDGPSHYPGIPRQWVVTLESGRQLLVRFTDSSETEIEVAQRSNQYATWSIAEPGVPA